MGEVGDNFAAGMTGGMSFVYDKNSQLEKKINPENVVWQKLETDYWKTYLKNLIKKHFEETQSSVSKNILDDYKNQLDYFFQICPKEMLDKLENPISKENEVIAS